MLLLATSYNASSSECLDELSKFAHSICGEINRNGGSTSLIIDGELSASANGLITKFVGRAGLEGKFKDIQTEYVNVLRKDLVGELKNTRQCKIEMVKIGIDKCSNK